MGLVLTSSIMNEIMLKISNIIYLIYHTFTSLWQISSGNSYIVIKCTSFHNDSRMKQQVAIIKPLLRKIASSAQQLISNRTDPSKDAFPLILSSSFGFQRITVCVCGFVFSALRQFSFTAVTSGQFIGTINIFSFSPNVLL